MPERFTDRTEAGRALAARLGHLAGDQVLVLALPRGGVPVGAEIAHALHAPLDVFNVRKLGVPWHEELAMGAIAAGGVRVLNSDVIITAGVSTSDVQQVTIAQQAELDRRERLYRNGRAAPDVSGKTVILVDDGIATGATARAAIAVLHSRHPSKLVLAVPVIQESVAEELGSSVEELVAVLTPRDLYAIGQWYDDFAQLSDDDVRDTLARAARELVESR
ncbi:MAG: phosphoribosyltransferase [Gemmatimonadaceae bacterium]